MVVGEAVRGEPPSTAAACRGRSTKANGRRFSASYNLTILDDYDRVNEPGAKGALLRREGLYSSHIVEWRRARDLGVLAQLGRPRGERA